MCGRRRGERQNPHFRKNRRARKIRRRRPLRAGSKTGLKWRVDERRFCPFAGAQRILAANRRRPRDGRQQRARARRAAGHGRAWNRRFRQFIRGFEVLRNGHRARREARYRLRGGGSQSLAPERAGGYFAFVPRRHRLPQFVPLADSPIRRARAHACDAARMALARFVRRFDCAVGRERRRSRRARQARAN